MASVWKTPIFLLPWLLGSVGIICSQATDQEIRENIDTIFNAAIQCGNIPGGNIAVVRNGEVFHTNGYGVKNLVSQEPFTSDTLVNIASITKHFMSTTMAKVFELNPGYDWQSTVRSILGNDFYLSDGYMSNKVTVKDLLCHRVGISGHDVLRSSGISLEEMVRRLRHLTSGLEFRDGHLYNNIMYNLADQIIRVITGAASWDDMAQASFFDQLQMNDTTFVQKGDRWEDFATAYINWADELQPMSLEVNKADYDLSSAAGGVATNAVDIAKWMMFHLSGGKAPDGTQLVDADLLGDTHAHCGIGGSSTYVYPGDPVTYNAESKGLGWFEGFYRSYAVDTHGGYKGGFHSQLTLMPDVNIGIFASVTGPQSHLLRISLYTADLLLNETVWIDEDTFCSKLNSDATDEFMNPYGELTQQEFGGEMMMQEPDVESVTEHAERMDMRALTDYEGTFGHFGYGNLTVYINGSTSELNMDYGPTRRWRLNQTSNTTFTARGYGVFWFMWNNLVFEDDGNGNYNALTANFASPSPRFTRDLDMSSAPAPPDLC